MKSPDKKRCYAFLVEVVMIGVILLVTVAVILVMLSIVTSQSAIP